MLTADNLKKQDIVVNNYCSLCGDREESIDHFCFDNASNCKYFGASYSEKYKPTRANMFK